MNFMVVMRREASVKTNVSTIDNLEKQCGPYSLVPDLRPKRWKNEADALADLELYRTCQLPTIPMKTLEGDPFQLAVFPRAVPHFKKEDDRWVVNPEWLAAPIEMRILVLPDTP